MGSGPDGWWEPTFFLLTRHSFPVPGDPRQQRLPHRVKTESEKTRGKKGNGRGQQPISIRCSLSMARPVKIMDRLCRVIWPGSNHGTISRTGVLLTRGKESGSGSVPCNAGRKDPSSLNNQTDKNKYSKRVSGRMV